MEAELELGYHPEVPAAAAKTPEQVRVLRFARAQDLAISGYDLEAGDVVACQSNPPGKPAHAPTEGQAADPGVRDVAGRGGQPERLGGSIEGAEQRAALYPRAP